MADVLTNKGEGWAVDRLVGTGGFSANNGAAGAMGTGVHTAAKTDTALTTEVETRASTTVSATGTDATKKYQAVWTQTATAARAIVEAGLFDSTTVAGSTMFTSHNFTAVNLATDDSIQFTLTIDPS